ncbi:MAG: glucans biosynthesis glucosyltransferase MdoH [Pikeienuella sp.]
MSDIATNSTSEAQKPVLQEIAPPAGLTPAGMQSARMLTRRRLIVIALNVLTMGALATGLIQIFASGGWTITDMVIFGCFLFGAPWTVMGFWNAVIGLWLLHGSKDGLAATSPFIDETDTSAITAKTAVLMFLRNEDPARAFARLVETRRSLDATGSGDQFDVYVLSDTDDAEIGAEEERLFDLWRSELGVTAHYRRRTKNTGWKAGNIRDFLDRWGQGYDYFLPLDSDSLMSGSAILRMARIMQRYPRLGILQSLVVGTPADSAFARIFQFGMRHGMRSFTMGAAWWHGDCGPYWGHNALVRVAPFYADCDLPVLSGKGPLSGHILSHDQVEAALMRRAGYEVRVLPVEGESWEDNPPTLFEFTRRDLRWCQGNMQYIWLLGTKGLKPMSRFQVFAAIMMYFGAPAWMLMTSAAAFKLFDTDVMDIDAAFAISMFFIMFAVSLFPKIAGWIDIALRTGGAREYGGRIRFAMGAAVETLFSIMLAPVVAFRVTLFMIGLLFGRSVSWSGQERDAHQLSWGTALRGLWPQSLFGKALFMMLLIIEPSVLPWAAPIMLGLCLAIPFAVLTSHPKFGRFAAKVRLCATPDEFALPPSLKALTEQQPPQEPAVKAA